MNKLTILTLALLIFLSPSAFSLDSSPIGTITYLEGISDITHSKEETSFLKDNEPVYVGDRIRTKSYSKAQINFTDESILRIGQSTCVIIKEYTVTGKNRREHATVMLTRGKVEAVVAKTGDPDTFVIETPNAKGSVKGSDIFVFFQAGKTGTLVREGSMSLVNPLIPEEKIKVTTGDYATVPFNEAPGNLRPYLGTEMKLHKRDVEPSRIKKWVPGKGAEEMKGVVAKTSGTTRSNKKGQADWQDVKKDDLLEEGDKVQTDDDGKLEIVLGNGSKIYLEANTELSFTKLRYDPKTGEYENTFESKYGKIKAIVEKKSKESTFQVKTPVAVVGVRGTIMYLNIQPTSTQAFYEGGPGVITSTTTGQSSDIGAGQNSTADASGVITPPVYTSSQQRSALDQSWTGTQAVDSYQAPLGSSTQEGSFQQGLAQGSPPGNMVNGG
ncbi:MAG: FecR family protein, partial [Candidatus Omnitrophota bacterium]